MKTQELIQQNPITMMRRVTMAMLLAMFSIALIAQSTVVDIVVNSEDHVTLEAAVIAAELADDLSGEGCCPLLLEAHPKRWSSFLKLNA